MAASISMKLAALLLVAGLSVFVGCGEGSDDEGAGAGAEEASMEAGSSGGDDRAPRPGGDGGGGGASEAREQGTTVAVGDSEFGRMLFGSDDQAIYIFENDSRDETVCYGDCAEDWPPVYTDGEPRAGSGVDQSLLGTVRRDDGRDQVTYDGQPLYFYANEAPGEVRCHNVNLNGGFWWAVGPDGERLP